MQIRQCQQRDFRLLQGFCKASAKAFRRAGRFKRLPGIRISKGLAGLRARATGNGRWGFFAKTALALAMIAGLVFAKMDLAAKGDCRLVPYVTTFAAVRIQGAVEDILKEESDYVEKGEVVDRDQRERMLRPLHPFARLQRPHIQRLGFPIPPLPCVEKGEVVGRAQRGR